MRTKAWIPVLLLIMVLGAVMNSALWITISAMLLTIMGVTSWWRDHALDGIVYNRRWHYRRSFPGETSPVRIEIENNKLLPVSWLRVIDPWPLAVAPDDSSALAPSHIRDMSYLTHLFSLRWYEKTRRDYILLFQKRGVYQVGPAHLSSGDLFGMYDTSTDLEKVEYLTVFPEMLPLHEIKLEAQNPFGDRASRRRIFDDPNRPVGVREYHPEDGFRKVHWPATARTGTLQVKVYQPVSSQVMMVCLNSATMTRYWEGVIPDMLEQLVKVATTIVYQGMQAGYSVGLISNSCLAHSDQPFNVAPGRSPRQLAHLLETLAGVTAFTSAPFESFLLKAMPRVPYGSTLVLVTALCGPELQETLVRLRRYRLHTTLISLAEETPPDIPGVRAVHLPYRWNQPEDEREGRSR
ncbi:MAG TPA: DUF58 domain-containing protein [Anaerolineaceae bacterium]|nr:DUF58 domain-containing protein [Anaerolineaceae bacterium]HPN52835.1 DUF58 domain-containing protein [Anaerolineaceae bacterium]